MRNTSPEIRGGSASDGPDYVHPNLNTRRCHFHHRIRLSFLDAVNGASGGHVLDAGVVTSDAGTDQLIFWFNADGSGANQPSYLCGSVDAAANHFRRLSPIAQQQQHVATVFDKGT